MKQSQDLLSLCQSICEGDGISPRHEKRRESNTFNHNDNKRLCRQIQKIARLVVSELGLTGWDIDNVYQHPGKTVIQVSVVAIERVNPEQSAKVLEWLKHHQGLIRAKIAQSIHRKQVPVLQFELGEVSYE